MKYGTVILASVGLVALVLSAPAAVAGPVELTGHPIGGYYTNGSSTHYYVASSLNVKGAICGGGYGLAFDGPTTVTSFSVDAQPDDGGGRRILPGFYVYANGQVAGYIDMDGTRDAQVDLPIWAVNADRTLALDGNDQPIPVAITANWLTLVPKEGSAALGMLAQTGAMQLGYSFHGTPYESASPTETDLNVGKTVTASGGTGGGSASSIVTGNLASYHKTNELYWQVNGADNTGARWATVYYDEATDIGSVGIALFAGSDGNRRAPVWVEIVGGTMDGLGQEIETGRQAVILDDVLTYYNRYNITEPGFDGIDWLRIEFPDVTDENDLANWWSRSGVTGLTAFQAFADPVSLATVTAIPEPATMSLLILGGLALRRRRR